MKLLNYLIIAFTIPIFIFGNELEEPEPIEIEQIVTPFSNPFVFDYHFSPKASAASMLSIHSGLQKLLDKAYKLDEPTILHSVGRFAELTFGWIPLNRMAVTTQHEVFGHGYRMRDFGKNIGEITGYGIGVPLPYGQGGGVTQFFPTNKATPTHFNLLNAAGMEGTALLANELKKRWFEKGAIDGRQGNLYTSAQHDLTVYSLLMAPVENKSKAGTGHDTDSYYHILTRTYPGSHMTRSDFRLLSLINLMDPMTYASVNSMWHYIVTGKSLNFSPTYLTNFRVGYAPYGPEIYLEHHQMVKDKPIFAYLKGGVFAENRYFGCGLEHRNLWQKNAHTLGGKLDIWTHPKLHLDNPIEKPKIYDKTIDSYEYQKKPNQLGCSLLGTYRFEKEDQAISTELQAGFKTAGFLPGESIHAAPIIRGSLNFKY